WRAGTGLRFRVMTRTSLFRGVSLLLIVLISQSAYPTGEETGSICIGRFEMNEPPERMGDPSLVCFPTSKLKFKIDEGEITAWPQKESVRIGGLSLQPKHRIRIYCGAKAQQSFTFGFS